MPVIGGGYFEFFSPVFNIADSSIFVGVVIILFMQKKFFKHHTDEETTAESTQQSVDDNFVSVEPLTDKNAGGKTEETIQS
jgi:signal peptidase II